MRIRKLAICLLVISCCGVCFSREIKTEWQSTSLCDLLAENAVGEKLELSDEQRDEIHRISQKARSELANGIRDALVGPTPEDQKEQLVKKIMGNLHAVEEEALTDVLLGYQMDTLKAIWRQREIDRLGLANALAAAKTELELTSDQLAKLKELEEQSKKERIETLARLKREAQSRLMSSLSPEQRRKWRAMIGDTLEVAKVEDE